MFVDIHAHLIPEAFLDRAAKDPDGPVRARWESDGQVHLTMSNGVVRRLDAAHWDIERRLGDMDRLGIAVQVVSVPPFLCFDWLPPAEAADVLPALNDLLLDCCRQHPTRLAPMCGLPLQHPEAAIRELQRCVELGVRTFQLPVTVAGRDLDAPEVEPVLAAAAAAGVLLFIHPLFLPELARLQEYYNNNLVGNPLETHLCAARLIFSGVLDRLPDLRVGLAHGGGYLPWGIARLEHGYAVRPETRGAALPPSQYLSRFFYDTVVHLPGHLTFLHHLVGSSQILLGTDWPFDMALPDPLGHLEQTHLDPAARAAIASENARRLGLLDWTGAAQPRRGG